jgi:cysteine-rich repeat protein
MGWIARLVVVALVVACGGNKAATPGGCEDGNADACTYACVDPAVDCGAAPACQVATCSDNECAFVPDASLDGTSCGIGQVCAGGACVPTTCGNGIKEGSEECDWGQNNGANAGCETTCRLSCASHAACDDGNACNGNETCEPVTVEGQGGQRCAPGSALAPGTSCGTGMLCINQQCTASSCGDSFTSSPEECDDADVTPGNGCENDCTFSCVSTDVTRNCTPADVCAGQGTCNDTSHTCTPGTPLANNSPCGIGGYCKNAVCTQPVCGNGTPEPGEQCDDGNPSNGDGCDTDCTYSCVNAATDCGVPPACQRYSCNAAHVCQLDADAAQNGMTCGSNGQTCNAGACTSGVCGNGITEAGEQCDFGSANNGSGTGCESTCMFSCTMLPNSCDDGDACNGAEACVANTVMGRAGQRCNAGTPLGDNTACGTGKICKSQACVSSICGDSYVDAALGETCEPPSTASCDASCHVMICGDGVRAGNEQCDDNNLVNLDGCSSTCKFEQCQRIIDLDFQFGTDPYCSTNALGGAVRHSMARDLLTDAIDVGVADGSVTIFFQLLGLDDLTGTTDPGLSVGVLSGTPVAGTGYNGNSDLDWWYTITAADLDASRVPLGQVPATINAKTLDAGPGNMKFNVNFVGVDVTMDMFNTRIQGQTGAATTPTVSTGGSPGHLASEHLDPALASFASIGTQSAPAMLCGATTAASLASTHIPASVVNICTNYTISHSMLDLFVGGCNVLIFVQVIRATQPDTSRDGADYEFLQDAQRRVIGCERNGASYALNTCLQNAGYTSFYKFTTDRVIGK